MEKETVSSSKEKESQEGIFGRGGMWNFCYKMISLAGKIVLYDGGNDRKRDRRGVLFQIDYEHSLRRYIIPQ